MGEIFDPEMLMIAGIILFVFLILNILFRLFSMPKFIKSSLIAVSFVGIVLLVFTYAIDNEELYATEEQQSSNYLIGKVTFVSKTMRKVNIDYIKSSIRTKATDKYVVNVSRGAKVYMTDAGTTQKGDLGDIKVGDIITIYCVEDSVEFDNPEVSATKIVKKGTGE